MARGSVRQAVRECGLRGCDRPAGDAYVCRDDQQRLDRDLRQLALLIGEAITTVSRLDRHGGGGKSSGEPLPVNLAAADRLAQVHAALTSTARWIAASRGIPLDLGQKPAQQATLWLIGQLGWLRHHPAGPDRYHQLGRACASLHHLVDRPPERRYLGECSAPVGNPIAWPCPADLYARPDATVVTCRSCGAHHDVTKRREWLDRLVRQTVATATDIGGAYGIPASTIRRWAHEGRIVPHGHDVHGRPVYPVAEVLDLAAELAARRAEREAKRAARQPSAGPADPLSQGNG